MYIPFKLDIRIPCTYIINCIKKINNWLFRPKLKLDLKQKLVTFTSHDGKDHSYSYFCLIIENCSNKTHSIKLKQIEINNCFYQTIIHGDTNFNKLNPNNKDKWLDCKNDLYKIYSANWLEIIQNEFSYPLNKFKQLTFPMRLLSSTSRCITDYKNKSLLFFPKAKISITIGINGTFYEYGINRKDTYERCINYLACLRDVS
jgi:hypothetical protein